MFDNTNGRSYIDITFTVTDIKAKYCVFLP